MAILPFAVIPLALEAISTGNERAERPAAHLGEFKHIGMVWQTNGTANAWVRGGSAIAKSIDFVAVLLANATAATTIRVRLDNAVINAQAGIYDSGALPFISPAVVRDNGLYCSHLELPAPVSAGYWRIDIGGLTGDFSAAKLVLGKKLTPATYYTGDFERGVEDLGSLDMTRWGVGDETPGLVCRTLALKFGWLSEADYEDKFARIADALGRRSPLFFCFDPTANRFRHSKTYFGPLRKLPFATGGAMPGRIQSDFQLLSMLPGSPTADA